LAGVAFAEVGALAGEAAGAGGGPGAEFAEFGNRMPAEAVFDGEPGGGGEMPVMDEAGFASPRGGDGELVEEAGSAAVLAELALFDAEALAEVGGADPVAGCEKVQLDLAGES
jgi:hypothetical protein